MSGRRRRSRRGNSGRLRFKDWYRQNRATRSDQRRDGRGAWRMPAREMATYMKQNFAQPRSGPPPDSRRAGCTDLLRSSHRSHWTHRRTSTCQRDSRVEYLAECALGYRMPADSIARRKRNEGEAAGEEGRREEGGGRERKGKEETARERRASWVEEARAGRGVDWGPLQDTYSANP